MQSRFITCGGAFFHMLCHMLCGLKYGQNTYITYIYKKSINIYNLYI